LLVTDRFKITKRKKTPEGYLLIHDCKLAQSGILKYMASEIGINDARDGKIVSVYRDPKTLFSDKVLESFRSKPVTLVHPTSLVTSENIKDTQVGFSKDDVHSENEFMVGSLLVTDKEAIKAIEDLKIVELSLGYEADFEQKKGVTLDGMPYDIEMTNIRGNHIAIVEKGRCGKDCKVADSQNPQKKEKEMETVKIVIDGINYDVTPQGEQLIKKLISDRDSLKVSLETEKADSGQKINDAESAKQAEVDDLKEKLKVEKAKVLDEAGIDEKVEARATLIATCRKLVGDVDAKGKSDIELKKLVVADKRSTDMSEKSDAYISAAFDLICEDQSSDTDNMFKDHATATSSNTTEKPEWEKKRDAKIEDNKKEWEEK